MKNNGSLFPGQIVRLIGSFGGDLVGKIVGPWDVENWSKVLTAEGVFTWPDSQLEVVTSTEESERLEAEIDTEREMAEEADGYDPEGEFLKNEPTTNGTCPVCEVPREPGDAPHLGFRCGCWQR